MGDSIQSELRTLENLFSRVRCPITDIKKIRKDSIHRHSPNTQEAPKEILQAVVPLIIL